MLSFKTLRSFTGRPLGGAGVLPHARWDVNILYALVASYGEEVASGRGEEEGRATWPAMEGAPGTKPG